jgi:hypothetical protein
VNTVETLLQVCSHTDTPYDQGMTPLILTASWSWEAQVHLRSTLASRQKHDACQYSTDMPYHVCVACALLACRADVDAQDVKGDISLHWASANDVPAVARILMYEAHTRSNITNKEGI